MHRRALLSPIIPVQYGRDRLHHPIRKLSADQCLVNRDSTLMKFIGTTGRFTDAISCTVMPSSRNERPVNTCWPGARRRSSIDPDNMITALTTVIRHKMRPVTITLVRPEFCVTVRTKGTIDHRDNTAADGFQVYSSMTGRYLSFNCGMLTLMFTVLLTAFMILMVPTSSASTVTAVMIVMAWM